MQSNCLFFLNSDKFLWLFDFFSCFRAQTEIQVNAHHLRYLEILHVFNKSVLS